MESNKVSVIIVRLQAILINSNIKKRQLNLIGNAVSALNYRVKKPVIEYVTYRSGSTYPLCPTCGAAIEYDYQRYCSYCGQCMKW